MILTALLSFETPGLLAQGLSLPAGNAGIEDAIGRGVAPESTAEELAAPPAGEIQKLYLQSINETRLGLASVVGPVPTGPEARQTPHFAKVQFAMPPKAQVRDESRPTLVRNKPCLKARAIEF